MHVEKSLIIGQWVSVTRGKTRKRRSQAYDWSGGGVACEIGGEGGGGIRVDGGPCQPLPAS